MRIIQFLLLLPVFHFAIAQSTSIDFQQFGDYGDLRSCVQDCLAEYQFLGCETNECLCGHQSAGQASLQTCVNFATSYNIAVVTDTASGLSEDDKLQLGLGIGLGVPGFIATCLAAYWTWKQWRSRRRERISRSHSAIDSSGPTTIHDHLGH